MSALSPMMHDEDACSNPLGPARVKARLWDDVETQDIYRMAASLHTRLAPYSRALAVQAHATGTPLTRHPFLLFPSSPEAWRVEDSFFIGDALYAAPVVRRGVTTRHVWLPPGRYVEWTEHTVHQGPAYVDVPAPLGRIPLFLVENQLVPLLDAEVQTLGTNCTKPSRADGFVHFVFQSMQRTGARQNTLGWRASDISVQPPPSGPHTSRQKVFHSTPPSGRRPESAGSSTTVRSEPYGWQPQTRHGSRPQAPTTPASTKSTARTPARVIDAPAASHFLLFDSQELVPRLGSVTPALPAPARH